jgi:hypothetical protein
MTLENVGNVGPTFLSSRRLLWVFYPIYDYGAYLHDKRLDNEGVY